MAPLPPGIVDTHVHSAPDSVPRLMDDLQIAAAARDAGYRAVVLKSHHTVTAARAQIAERAVPGVTVLGGVALNLHATGGINTYALDAALRMGARIVWMPTFTSRNQVSQLQAGGGDHLLRGLGEVKDEDAIDVVDDTGRLKPEVLAALDLMAAADVTLATGHLSAREIMLLVPEARRRGVSRVIVTHPELHCVDLPVDDQVTLAALGGVWFERVFAITLPHIGFPIERIAENAKAVGYDTTLLATDLGQAVNQPPVEGMGVYIERIRACGIGMDDIELMTCAAPAAAMGLG